MKTQCKTCGKNCDGEYCFQHKPRKQLMSNGKPMRKVKLSGASKELYDEMIADRIQAMQQFFLQIWKKRQHLSEISGLPLVGEPLSVYFHHILPKEKYPEAALDEENIILLTLNEHNQVESDIYRYEEVNKRREYLKQKYEIS
jgi:hypothetical protein